MENKNVNVAEDIIDEEVIDEDNRNIVLEIKKKMLLWDNPVEFINNMYGCHPLEKEKEYFKTIFSKKN